MHGYGVLLLTTLWVSPQEDVTRITTLASFDFGSGLQGWTVFANPDSPSVTWAADATPSGVPGGASMSGNSLNFNDGTDYDGPETPDVNHSGVAQSPEVSLTPVTNSGDTPPLIQRVFRLVFFCNYNTETEGQDRDQRIFQVLRRNPGGGEDLLTVSEVLSTVGHNPIYGNCEARGSWHKHEINLDPNWSTIRLRVSFDTIDPFNNTLHGWFIDEVRVFYYDIRVGVTPPPPVTEGTTGKGREDRDSGGACFSQSLPPSSLPWIPLLSWAVLVLLGVNPIKHPRKWDALSNVLGP